MKGKRPRKKVVVFLVDGPSEINALSPTVSALYESIDPEYEIFFPYMTEEGKAKDGSDDTEVTEHWGDLTSKHGINPSTIEKCIEKLYFNAFLKNKKLYPKDITEIIHILDLDGAYIPDSQVVLGDNPLGASKPFYDSDKIITTNVTQIVERNQHKRENIDYLQSLSKIKIGSKTIPYSTYFFSSNLDHFLHNDANIVEGRDKVKLAEDFALKYVDSPKLLVSSIESTPGALTDMTYEESWSFIRERGNHSLSRHTNINVLFQKLMSDHK